MKPDLPAALMAVVVTLLFPCPFMAASERVIVAEAGMYGVWDFSAVSKLLNQGWTVKHQPVTIGESSRVLFVLVPPPPDFDAEKKAREEAAIEQAKRAAVFAKRREEYLAKQKATPVEAPKPMTSARNAPQVAP